ncbi:MULTISPECIES: hypothetical protein [Pseudoalteromonas]|uniref:DUF91 domain-containing protein n=1 Tax=Pseudoalteromonas amylolytica TaxID=1859457 RepID=A0A1S1MXM1_9GAMM|nr:MULTISPECIES: hypothetical protein [Pseudoalteromonas]OHU89210.1 hypothetical protein BFC16_06115 [Pseudoalteromonas sp. JW3]OHU92110.1 hypothetical protein BET10_07220 [Pseudoalteromonas amylolytica]
MPLYQITNDALLELPSTSFQQESLWERRDLQRLLKVNIQAIDENVMVIAEEFGDWSESGRRIDLLAIDRDANLVVIELKRTDCGGHMELQAIRYAAMVANMTWDHAKSAFQKYLINNQIDADAEAKLCEFLGWSDPNEDDFAQNVRIVLASANFSKEITTSVLWLNDRDLDISCVRLSLHKIDDKLVLSADQIIPLPEAESYQIEVKQKRRQERVSRTENKDRSLFSITYMEKVYAEGFKKSDIAYHTVSLLDEKGLIDDDVFDFLRSDTSCSFRLLKHLEEMTETEKRYSKYRFNREPEIRYGDSGYYIARNWGVNNVQKFIDKIEARFPKICYSSNSNI